MENNVAPIKAKCPPDCLSQDLVEKVETISDRLSQQDIIMTKLDYVEREVSKMSGTIDSTLQQLFERSRELEKLKMEKQDCASFRQVIDKSILSLRADNVGIKDELGKRITKQEMIWGVGILTGFITVMNFVFMVIFYIVNIVREG